MRSERAKRGPSPRTLSLSTMLVQLQQFFTPSLDTSLAPSHGADVRWLQVREQILTGILRTAAILSILAFAASTQLVAGLGIWPLGLLYGMSIGLITLLALRRQIPYRLRAISFLTALYVVALTEIACFGYTEDAYGYLTSFALLSLILFGGRAGVAALLASVATLSSFGLGQSLGAAAPLVMQIRPLTPELAITTSVLFLTCVGVTQAAVTVLLNHIDAAWQESQRARNLLEQRVAERTQELAEARDQALALSHYRSEQNQFLSALHQTALDLLQHQDRGQILRVVMDRACAMLDAPYGQLLLIDGDHLVVHTYTENIAPPDHVRLGRDHAQLSWQAIDEQRPTVVDCYARWSARQPRHDALALQAAANFPIMYGDRCLGVLALARGTPGYTFSADEIQKGQLFSQLAAVVIDNADLYTTALREIAERRAAEDALKAQNAELDAFAHTVAHDLKGPLTYLIGNTEFLRLTFRQQSAQELDEQLVDTLAVSRKMHAIIEALLMLSSVRSRRQVPRVALSMGAIVTESLRRVQPLAREKGAAIALPDRWPEAAGYAPWVEEIWVNYLSNALKYGGSPPQIALGAELLEGGQARFWVQDSGPGLTPEEQAQLFTPFTRLQDTNIQGHGLGLSIVQRIATQLGGGVGVESGPVGSRFFFTLPTAADPLAGWGDLLSDMARG
jgi:signal transduction histidine kinase